eukprot:NODE_2829_length_2137_cov_10.427363.p1 GENE.NODE_2829_length_2137_cov_10.427363~~NODE_2829_length_2137_cov_10.427363.p1  ORF type:complete len:604 (-),score=126.53 NODE_2829_length_2137_cov_10.427363:245-2056(-)
MHSASATMELVEEEIQEAVARALPDTGNAGVEVCRFQLIRRSVTIFVVGNIMTNFLECMLPTMTVYLMDSGFDEADLALVKVITTIPMTFKMCYAPLIDYRRPPWTGGMFLPAGRRKPVLVYSLLIGVLGMVAFSLFVAGSPTVPGTLICGFVMISGSAVCGLALDSHASEMLGREPPEYLPVSVTRYSSHVSASRGLSRAFANVVLTLWLTQLGPSWSWKGACLVVCILVLIGPIAFLGLTDLVHQASPQAERPINDLLHDWLFRRGADKDLFIFHQKLDLVYCLFAFGFCGSLALYIPYIKREFDINSQQQGYYTVIYILGFIGGSLLAVPLSRLLSVRCVLLTLLTIIVPFPIGMYALMENGQLILTYPFLFFSGLATGPLFAMFFSACYANMVPSAPVVSTGGLQTAFNLAADASLILLVVAQWVSYLAAECIISAAWAICCVFAWRFFYNEGRLSMTSLARQRVQSLRIATAAEAAAAQTAANGSLTREQVEEVTRLAAITSLDLGFNTPRALQMAATAAEQAIAQFEAKAKAKQEPNAVKLGAARGGQVCCAGASGCALPEQTAGAEDDDAECVPSEAGNPDELSAAAIPVFQSTSL